MPMFYTCWTRFWMRFAGWQGFGRFAARMASWLAPPLYRRIELARFHPRGYVAPSARLDHPGLQMGAHSFIGDRVAIFRDLGGGAVTLGDRALVLWDTTIQTGSGGTVSIGADTHIQPRCQFSAYKGSIRIGDHVEIAPNCAFYPYEHGIAPGQAITAQPLHSRGDIVIEDGAWLGYGVIVLDGVTIGQGAVIGAGSVVTRNIPDNAVAMGVPARVTRKR